MTTPSDKPTGSSFSTFGLGVAFGIAAAFLFGTVEGRKIVKKIAESIPEKFGGQAGSLAPHRPIPTPIVTAEETPHHTTFDYNVAQSMSVEAPPPPAPAVRPSRPEPFVPGQ